MAGHNKWSKIKRKKGVNDAKNSKIFSRIVKEIQVAVKLGGSEAENNPRLRTAIQNAKGVNMPKDNVERAIKKASGETGATFEEFTMEGYGNHGVAVFVECTTDNRNRTVANIRSYFNKNNGSLAKNGSLDFIFDQKGIFNLGKQADLELDEESLMLELIDAGAEDIEKEDESGEMTVITPREAFGEVQSKLEELGIEAEDSGLRRIPKVYKQLSPDEFASIQKLIDTIEDDDDVLNVYHNVEPTPELEQMM